MQRVNKILNNSEYNKRLREIEEAETDRIFCRHDMNHFLDVARIAALICKDENIETDKGYVYAASLLHDIGRAVQYKEGIAHEEASAEIAQVILEECGYNESERRVIIDAVKNHGDEAVKVQKNLTGVIYRADKLSRKCFSCKAAAACHKSEDKRNMQVIY